MGFYYEKRYDPEPTPVTLPLPGHFLHSDLEESGLHRFYIAGPMTGIPDHNRGAFELVAKLLRADGYTPISPVELDLEAGIDLTRDAFTDAEVNGFLRRDLLAILDSKAQGVVVLPGWEESRGAALEVHVARELSMPIFDGSGGTVERPTKYRPPTDETIAETAGRLVGGDRQDQYGHPIEDFERTAGIINAIYGTEFGPEDIPVIMVAVKLSRIRQSPGKRDSWVDLVGYALTAELVAERQGEGLR